MKFALTRTLRLLFTSCVCVCISSPLPVYAYTWWKRYVVAVQLFLRTHLSSDLNINDANLFRFKNKLFQLNDLFLITFFPLLFFQIVESLP